MKKGKMAAGAVCSVGLAISMLVTWGNVKTNQAGLEIIGNAESCMRNPYTCPAGKATDGIGNTTNVHEGKSDEEIARDWERNILVAESCINRNFRGEEMPIDTFSAMTSAAFNMGCPTLLTYYSKANKRRVETSIHKWAQAGNWVNMCGHLPDFRGATVNGVYTVMPGLEARRNKEMALCLKGANNE